MKRLLKTIWFWPKIIFSINKDKRLETIAGRNDRSHNPFSLLLGKIYRYGVNKSEATRLKRFKIEEEIEKHKIISEIYRYSKRTLIYLLVSVIVAYGADYLFSFVLKWLTNFNYITDIFSTPNKSFIGDGLTAYISAVSALLGLIFALYAVGFQLTTDRYSEKVTSFISNDKVSSYFFEFLVFTDLFAVIVYVKLITTDSLPLFSFIMATLLVATSFLGIIIFKNHYVEIIKPESMFTQIQSLIWESIDLVATPGRYTKKSWSLATHARKRVRSNIRVAEALYRDLTRNDITRSQNWTDASFAPLVAGYILQGYSGKRRYIDIDKPWWTAQRDERVKSSDLNMYSIKLQHGLKGTGPLIVPQNHTLWFEDQLFGFLVEIEKDISNDNTGYIFMNLSNAYKTALVGNYQRQVDAPPKLLPGAWQNQELEMFDRSFIAFIGLWQKVDISTHKAAANYVNDYFSIISEVIEPWNIELVLSIVDSFYKGDQLNQSDSFLSKGDLPSMSRAILRDYWERLDVEQKLEGRIVTEKGYLLDEVRDLLESKRNDLVDKYLMLAFDDSTKIIESLQKSGKYELMVDFIKMQMEWISHLLYTRQLERANLFSDYVKKACKYLLLVPQQIVEEEELIDQVEKGYFVALMEECKDVFTAYSEAASIVLLIDNWQQRETQNQDGLIRSAKFPLIWGSMAFTLSELRQDSFWVTTFTKHLERMFRPDLLPQLLESVANLQYTKDAYWETTRYMNWERWMFRKIRDEVSEVSEYSAGEIGYGTRFDHPSDFISHLSTMDFVFDNQAKEAYVEWLKRRQVTKGLIAILLQLAEVKSNA